MKHESKLNSGQQEELKQAHQQENSLEFDSAEAMLRHEALHTPVPPSIEVRLVESIAKEQPPAKGPWWKRLIK